MPALKSDWAEAKRRLRSRFPVLTEEELDSTDGEREAVVALMELRLGYGSRNAEQDLDHLLESPAEDERAPRDETDGS